MGPRHTRHHVKSIDLTNVAVEPFTDETGAPATLPEMGAGGEESKMKVLLGLLRKCVGLPCVDRQLMMQTGRRQGCGQLVRSSRCLSTR